MVHHTSIRTRGIAPVPFGDGCANLLALLAQCACSQLSAGATHAIVLQAQLGPSGFCFHRDPVLRPPDCS